MIFKDQTLLAEAYNMVSEKTHKCGEDAKKCKCKNCKECKEARKKEIKEPTKKSTKDKEVKEESLSSFKRLFNSIISESSNSK